MTIVRVCDLRTCGVCPMAKRKFFERHGLDWKDFLRNGMDADEARKFGDHLDWIDRLEQAAIKRENGK